MLETRAYWRTCHSSASRWGRADAVQARSPLDKGHSANSCDVLVLVECMGWRWWIQTPDDVSGVVSAELADIADSAQ